VPVGGGPQGRQEQGTGRQAVGTQCLVPACPCAAAPAPHLRLAAAGAGVEGRLLAVARLQDLLQPNQGLLAARRLAALCHVGLAAAPLQLLLLLLRRRREEGQPAAAPRAADCGVVRDEAAPAEAVRARQHDRAAQQLEADGALVVSEQRRRRRAAPRDAAAAVAAAIRRFGGAPREQLGACREGREAVGCEEGLLGQQVQGVERRKAGVGCPLARAGGTRRRARQGAAGGGGREAAVALLGGLHDREVVEGDELDEGADVGAHLAGLWGG
jgi:hypothetical protein